jgi:hypothetical protein
MPQINIGLSSDGLQQIEIFAATPEARAEALQMILRGMTEIRALEAVFLAWVKAQGHGRIRA